MGLYVAYYIERYYRHRREVSHEAYTFGYYGLFMGSND